MPARFRGRTNSRNSSGSGMEEYPPHFGIEPFVRPIRMLGAQSGPLQFARRPIESFRQTQPLFAGHSAEEVNLFPTGWFIRPHESRVRPGRQRSKHNCLENRPVKTKRGPAK